ncbi:Uncharacterised protein [Mycobacteroides abscessus subsp. abscessus]|nr:Uncharacterised protein [Mycobacteroides abscessus subsp. abscessus]
MRNKARSASAITPVTRVFRVVTRRRADARSEADNSGSKRCFQPSTICGDVELSCCLPAQDVGPNHGFSGRAARCRPRLASAASGAIGIG